MASRWTLEEDHFLFNFYCPMLETTIAFHDLDRSAAAIRARVKLLKESGAWAIMDEWKTAIAGFEKRYEDCLKAGGKQKRKSHLKVVQ